MEAFRYVLHFKLGHPEGSIGLFNKIAIKCNKRVKVNGIRMQKLIDREPRYRDCELAEGGMVHFDRCLPCMTMGIVRSI